MIVKLAVASVASVAAVAVAAGVDLDRGGSPPAVPTRQVAASGARPDTTSDAEARRMRRIVIVLAG
jgi:hypothetical protein